MILHRKEFPEITIPDCIRLAYHKGLIVDVSWHNDVAPSFCLPHRAVDCEMPRLWVSHEDPKQREADDYPHYAVYLADGEALYEGDDAEEALHTLLTQSN